MEISYFDQNRPPYTEMTPGILRKTVMMIVQNGLQTILVRIYSEIESNLSWYLREQGQSFQM